MAKTATTKRAHLKQVKSNEFDYVFRDQNGHLFPIYYNELEYVMRFIDGNIDGRKVLLKIKRLVEKSGTLMFSSKIPLHGHELLKSE
jgi:hypothetical protein